MTLQATSTQGATSFVQRALQVDALFSGLSGLALSLASGPISAFLGVDAPLALVGVGLGLLAWTALLLLKVAPSPVNPTLLWLVIEGNVLWVIISGLILFTGWLPLTTSGWWAVALVADVVAVFAVLQFYGLRRERAKG